MLSLLKYVFVLALFAATAYGQNVTLYCPSNYTCAGEDVTLVCTASTPDVKWDIYDASGNLVVTYLSFPTINFTLPVNDSTFTFETSDLNSTVTFDARYDLDGYIVACTDVVFTVNDTTNETTTANATASCPITVADPPPTPSIRTYSIQDTSVTIFWTYPTELSDCVLMVWVTAVPDNTTIEPITHSFETSVTNATLSLMPGITYTISVTAMSMNENVTSNSICIQLSSPGMVTNLMGMYRPEFEDISVSWEAPVYPVCQRPDVTSYNVTHNATDGSNEGSGSGGADMTAMNETITLLSNETAYTFSDIVYGNVYFVEVIPFNTFGAGYPRVTFITATSAPTPPSTGTPPTQATTESPTTEPGGLSPGAIAGIVIAIVVVVILVVAVIVVIVAYLTCCRVSDPQGTNL